MVRKPNLFAFNVLQGSRCRQGLVSINYVWYWPMASRPTCDVTMHICQYNHAMAGQCRMNVHWSLEFKISSYMLSIPSQDACPSPTLERRKCLHMYSPMSFHPWVFTHEFSPMSFHPWVFTHEFSPMSFHPWVFTHEFSPMSFHPCVFTHEFSPMSFHPWVFTHEFSPMSFHPWVFTHEFSPMRFHPWVFTHEFSPMRFHPWVFTHEFSPMSFHPWVFTHEFSSMSFHACCSPRTFHNTPLLDLCVNFLGRHMVEQCLTTTACIDIGVWAMHKYMEWKRVHCAWNKFMIQKRTAALCAWSVVTVRRERNVFRYFVRTVCLSGHRLETVEECPMFDC